MLIRIGFDYSLLYYLELIYLTLSYFEAITTHSFDEPTILNFVVEEDGAVRSVSGRSMHVMFIIMSHSSIYPLSLQIFNCPYISSLLLLSTVSCQDQQFIVSLLGNLGIEEYET